MGSQALPCAGVSVHCVADSDGGTLVALGLIDGGLSVGRLAAEPTTSVQPLPELWTRSHKTPLRRVRFASSSSLFAVTAGRSLVHYDAETGKRKRVLAKATKAKPYALLPFLRGSFSVVAVGDEGGAVSLWDVRSSEARVAEWSVHEDFVADLAVTEDGRQLVSVSADSTLAAYSVPGKKVMVQSEPLASELMSVCRLSAEGRAYFAAGGGDGGVALFRKGEYGNLLERADTRHDGSLDSLLALGEAHPNFLLSGSNEDGSIRLLHIHPHRDLVVVGEHEDGTEEMAVTKDDRFVLSVGQDDAFRVWDLQRALQQVPLGTLKEGSAKDVRKKMRVRTAVADPTFFDGLGQGATDLSVPTASGDGSGED